MLILSEIYQILPQLSVFFPSFRYYIITSSKIVFDALSCWQTILKRVRNLVEVA
ncbi:hypothetical protein YC2023_083465 [Brassica napus]